MSKFNLFLVLLWTALMTIEGSQRHGDIGHDMLNITIPWATLVGKRVKVRHRLLGVFLGLPYAKPPVGELRFKLPSPLDPVLDHGVFEATSFGPPCPQPPDSNHQYNDSSENCLFLNVWTPATDDQLYDARKNIGLKPVLFYIYGGGFHKGSVNDDRHHGDFLSAFSGTVVVTVNHRLNVLGFGFGGTEEMPGNMGIYDLIKALEWVNKNIKYFGGNPNSVTLFGACSGAMAASAFALSPVVGPPLFSKIYLASSVASPRSVFRTPDLMFNLTRTVAESVGCGNRENPDSRFFTESQMNCLREADVHSLLNVSISDELLDQLSWRISPPFVPIYGNDFLPESPDYLAKKKLPSRRVPILFGNEEEEDEMLTPFWPSSKQEAKELLINMTFKSSPEITYKRFDEIFDDYFYRVQDFNLTQIKRALTNAAGDFLHHCPLLLFAETWARNGQMVHGYLNSYIMEGENQTERLFGTKHGDTAFQLLGQAYRKYELFTDTDRYVTRKMIVVLSDFAYGKRMRWPPMILNSTDHVYPLKLRFTSKMNPRNVFADPKDTICHMWGHVKGLVVG